MMQWNALKLYPIEFIFMRLNKESDKGSIHLHTKSDVNISERCVKVIHAWINT